MIADGHRRAPAIASAGAAALRAEIKAKAIALGFDDVGIADAGGDPRDFANLAAYLDQGRHGEMHWLAETRDRRADPQALWPAARSIVVCALNYGPEEDLGASRNEAASGAIAAYALGRDYHKVMKKRLKALGRWLVESCGCEVKVFVDTAPVMEKPLAARAGIGWIGKHTNLVSRRFGSWLLLGEVFTTLELTPDPPATDHCGSCDRCLAACPTAALPEPYRIEPRSCLSYLTIEHKGEIAPALADAQGNRVYGCDDCLAVCPWNHFARPAAETNLRPRPQLANRPLAELAALDEAGFRSRFAGTAIKRTGRDRFVRNVINALANAGEGESDQVQRLAASDPSPLVRQAAARAGRGEAKAEPGGGRCAQECRQPPRPQMQIGTGRPRSRQN